MKVLKGIELIQGSNEDSNIYVIDGEIIVDTGTGKLFLEHKNEIAEKFDAKNIVSIINTHSHFDHTGGNKKFRDWLKASIYCHAMDRDSIEKGDTLAKLFGETPKTVTIDNTIEDGDLIRTKNFSFYVIHTQGHTQGSICLYEKNKKILISGDTLFENGIGRTDFPGGNEKEMINSIKKLSNLDINYLLPGHGQLKMTGVNFYIKSVLNLLTKNRISYVDRV